jgi:molybdenum cofactor cytidylyltransferase
MTFTNKQESKFGVIILAAGASTRLGRPKQLLAYEGTTLLQHAVQAARASDARPVVIVLGADAETMQNGLPDSEVLVVVNGEWKEGMASSIRIGLTAFSEISPDAEGVILMVCDQPFVSASLLNELMAAYQKTRKPVVACAYEETFGPPVFFHHSLFIELLQLKGDIGARGVVRQHADAVELIPFPEGTFDVDTESDYKKLNKTGQA